MSITPLYTAEEIDAEITQAKADLAAARKKLSYTVDPGGQRIQVQREQVKALQDHLVWLQEQRAQLTTGHGPQSIQGRVFRG